MIAKLRRGRCARRSPVEHVSGAGTTALVLGLHGYGGDERQLESLLRLPPGMQLVAPRAPEAVDPGYGWWRPNLDGLAVDLAPRAAVEGAVDTVTEHIERVRSTANTGGRLVLVGYSQGAALALEVEARHPGLVAGVATVAGALVVDELDPVAGDTPMLIMNGSLDPLIAAVAHESTIDRFRRAGRTVTTRRDAVPHVVDQAQAQVLAAWISEL